MNAPSQPQQQSAVEGERRGPVLDSALRTFARFGYRKTSMDEVARHARISRPGLYFLFSSKQELFRAAVVRALEMDLATVEQRLSASTTLESRVADAFDAWAGRYVGAGARDITAVIEANPDLVGTIVDTAPVRFEELLVEALTSDLGPDRAAAAAQTLISTSIGLKHQVETRETYRERLATAIDLILGWRARPASGRQKTPTRGPGEDLIW